MKIFQGGCQTESIDNNRAVYKKVLLLNKWRPNKVTQLLSDGTTQTLGLANQITLNVSVYQTPPALLYSPD
jgi:hypothetical protein